MRIFSITPGGITESAELPQALPTKGYVWLSCSRAEFTAALAPLQTALQTLCGAPLMDLHVTDLANEHLPSHYDFTSQYDLLVFRRLATGLGNETAPGSPPAPSAAAPYPPPRSGPPVLKRINTSPVGFAVFDRVLLTVHPADCLVRDAYAAKLLSGASSEPPARSDPGASGEPQALPASHAPSTRRPTSPPDLMLRIINHMVDGFLELRRELTHQLDHWQTELINPGTRFNNWRAVLDVRLSLHRLDEICEDQRAAIQDWLEALKTWPETTTPAEARERELLHVRSRDVLEHIERVLHHVRRLEQNAETAVQIHFSVQGSRTNDIMRTLTVLTAIFLPLNLITGFFGMNFEFLPLIHNQTAFWWTFGTMIVIAIVTVLVFWRKRYLARTGR